MNTWHRYSRVFTLFFAHLILMCALMTVALSSGAYTAWADETSSGGVATLQISADGSNDSPLAVNKQYAFTAGQTWEDLLNVAVAAGDLDGFELSDWGFPQSVTIDGTKIENASDWSKTWMSYINSDGMDSRFNTQTYKTIALVDGEKYQMVYEGYPSSFDWSAVPEPEQIPQGDDPSDDGEQDAPEPERTPQTTVSSTASFKNMDDLNTLCANIANAYKGTKLDWNALDLVAACMADQVDTEGVLANAHAAYSDPDSTSLQRSIIALTALGIDATAVPSGSSTENLVQKMATTQAVHSTMYAQAFALLAYESGSYAVPANAQMTKDQLIAAILATQLPNGGFGYDGENTDADTTAMMLAALAPYTSRSDVKAAVNKAVEQLKRMQKGDGGFGSTLAQAGSNTPSTAQVIIALCALGIDPETFVTANGSTPISYVLSTANATKTGFLYDGAENDFATEQGLRALLAYKSFKASGTAFNIYIQAKDKLLCANAAQDDTTANKNHDSTYKGSSYTPKSGVTPHSSAKTSDSTETMPALALCIAAWLVMVAARNRMQVRKD